MFDQTAGQVISEFPQVRGAGCCWVLPADARSGRRLCTRRAHGASSPLDTRPGNYPGLGEGKCPLQPCSCVYTVMSDAEAATARRFSIGILRPSEDRVARLATWYSLEHDRLVRFAYLLTRDTGAAEDLVQDAFIKMYSVRDPIDEAGYPAYARRVIVNLARSRFRRLAVEHRVARSLPASEVVERDHAADMDVRRALMALSVSDRACLALRYFEGQTDAEIAATLGIGRSAAKKRVTRAHERLRRHLEEES